MSGEPFLQSPVREYPSAIKNGTYFKDFNAGTRNGGTCPAPTRISLSNSIAVLA